MTWFLPVTVNSRDSLKNEICTYASDGTLRRTAILLGLFEIDICSPRLLGFFTFRLISSGIFNLRESLDFMLHVYEFHIFITCIICLRISVSKY